MQPQKPKDCVPVSRSIQDRSDLKPLTNAFFRLPGTSAFPPLALLISLDSDSLVLGRIPFASVDDMLMMIGKMY